MKKSYLHAIIAFAYIVILVTIMSLKMDQDGNPVLTGIAVLSTLVFSAALMGYLFGSQPILMYIDGKKREAVKFFMETLITFWVLGLVSLAIMFLTR